MFCLASRIIPTVDCDPTLTKILGMGPKISQTTNHHQIAIAHDLCTVWLIPHHFQKNKVERKLTVPAPLHIIILVMWVCLYMDVSGKYCSTIVCGFNPPLSLFKFTTCSLSISSSYRSNHLALLESIPITVYPMISFPFPRDPNISHVNTNPHNGRKEHIWHRLFISDKSPSIVVWNICGMMIFIDEHITKQGTYMINTIYNNIHISPLYLMISHFSNDRCLNSPLCSFDLREFLTLWKARHPDGAHGQYGGAAPVRCGMVPGGAPCGPCGHHLKHI